MCMAIPSPRSHRVPGCRTTSTGDGSQHVSPGRQLLHDLVRTDSAHAEVVPPRRGGEDTRRHAWPMQSQPHLASPRSVVCAWRVTESSASEHIDGYSPRGAGTRRIHRRASLVRVTSQTTRGSQRPCDGFIALIDRIEKTISLRRLVLDLRSSRIANRRGRVRRQEFSSQGLRQGRCARHLRGSAVDDQRACRQPADTRLGSSNYEQARSVDPTASRVLHRLPIRAPAARPRR